MAFDPTALLIGMFVFGAVMFGLLGLAWGGQTAGSAAARQRLEGFTRGGSEAVEEKVVPASFGARVLAPMLHSVEAAFGNLLPKFRRAFIRSAGCRWRPELDVAHRGRCRAWDQFAATDL